MNVPTFSPVFFGIFFKIFFSIFILNIFSFSTGTSCQIFYLSFTFHFSLFLLWSLHTGNVKGTIKADSLKSSQVNSVSNISDKTIQGERDLSRMYIFIYFSSTIVSCSFFSLLYSSILLYLLVKLCIIPHFKEVLFVVR